MGLSGGKLCGLHPPAEQPFLELHERPPVTLLIMPAVKVAKGVKRAVKGYVFGREGLGWLEMGWIFFVSGGK